MNNYKIYLELTRFNKNEILSNLIPKPYLTKTPSIEYVPIDENFSSFSAKMRKKYLEGIVKCFIEEGYNASNEIKGVTIDIKKIEKGNKERLVERIKLEEENLKGILKN